MWWRGTANSTSRRPGIGSSRRLAAVADQLRNQRASLSALAPGRAGVEQYVRAYLSVEHRDNPDDGCPSAALLDEIGRCTDATKQA